MDDLTIEFAFLYAYYTDKANAAMQCTPETRFRPLTIGLAKQLENEDSACDHWDEVLEWAVHR